MWERTEVWGFTPVPSTTLRTGSEFVEVAQGERPNLLVVSPSNHERVKLFVGIWDKRYF